MVPVDDNVCDIKDETDQEMMATDRVLVVTNLETMEPKIISGTTAGSAVTSFRWLNDERLLVSRAQELVLILQVYIQLIEMGKIQHYL